MDRLIVGLDVAAQMMGCGYSAEVVKSVTNKTPREVGAEKIAHAAHHALEILDRLRDLTGQPIPLAWVPGESGARVIEVYTDATLMGRVGEMRGYKKNKPAGQDLRAKIAEMLREEIPDLVRYVDEPIDVFDACLCILAAKDFLSGQCAGPDDMNLARKEGWIWVRPKAPIEDLH